MKSRATCSLGGLLLGLGVGVGKSHVEFLASLDDSKSLADGNTLGNLSAVDPVVHEEELSILLAGDKELLEAGSKLMSGGLILLVTNGWHLLSTSISSSGEAIDTSDLSVGVGLTKNFRTRFWYLR